VRLLDHTILHAPRVIPRKVVVFTEAELPPESPAMATTGESLGLDLLRDLGGGSSAVTPPSPPSNTAKRIKLGGQVQAAKVISQPSPIYPALARQARIQGNVILHAVLDQNGRVSELHVISGHPLLVQAALDAVKQWRYQPTLLNNEPVEVDTTITVTFVLGG
jgi:periplasmic protein TonB